MKKSTMGVMAVTVAIASVVGVSVAGAAEVGCTFPFFGTSACAGGRSLTTGLNLGVNKGLTTRLNAGVLSEAWGRLPSGQLISTCYVADTTPSSGADPVITSGCNAAVSKRVHVVF
jgi:hypothetical protein